MHVLDSIVWSMSIVRKVVFRLFLIPIKIGLKVVDRVRFGLSPSTPFFWVFHRVSPNLQLFTKYAIFPTVVDQVWSKKNKKNQLLKYCPDFPWLWFSFFECRERFGFRFSSFGPLYCRENVSIAHWNKHSLVQTRQATGGERASYAFPLRSWSELFWR